uniref:Calmodulin-lysine N-methyltransferase n=1 Tax=Seriola lalandi dorsalis TaxID=1841481 RepID=A0A3B4YP33_SERLL
MERDSTGAEEKTEPASPLRKDINDDTCVLRQKQVDNPEVKQASVRRFASFDLFSRKRLVTQDPSDTSDDQWVEYRSVYFPEYSALLRYVHLNGNKALVSWCFWFCSFVLCCFISLSLSCLSVSQVAICADVKEVLLSDGNEKSIQSILSSSSLLLFLSISLSLVVRWDCEPDISALEGHFDIVMCADCLFVDQYRASLVDAIRRLLQPDGMALVFAPLRGETLRLFCQLAQRAGLCVSQHQQYDAQVWDVHLKVRSMSKSRKTPQHWTQY